MDKPPLHPLSLVVRINVRGEWISTGWQHAPTDGVSRLSRAEITLVTEEIHRAPPFRKPYPSTGCGFLLEYELDTARWIDRLCEVEGHGALDVSTRRDRDVGRVNVWIQRGPSSAVPISSPDTKKLLRATPRRHIIRFQLDDIRQAFERGGASTVDLSADTDQRLDALRHRPHKAHFTVEESVGILKRIGAKKSFLIHMCHDLDHAETERGLPEGIAMSYDGMVVEL